MTADEQLEELGFKKTQQKGDLIKYSRNDEYIIFQLQGNRVSCFGYVLSDKVKVDVITSRKMREIEKNNQQRKSWFREAIESQFKRKEQK